MDTLSKLKKVIDKDGIFKFREHFNLGFQFSSIKIKTIETSGSEYISVEFDKNNNMIITDYQAESLVYLLIEKLNNNEFESKIQNIYNFLKTLYNETKEEISPNKLNIRKILKDYNLNSTYITTIRTLFYPDMRNIYDSYLWEMNEPTKKDAQNLYFGLLNYQRNGRRNRKAKRIVI